MISLARVGATKKNSLLNLDQRPRLQTVVRTFRRSLESGIGDCLCFFFCSMSIYENPICILSTTAVPRFQIEQYGMKEWNDLLPSVLYTTLPLLYFLFSSTDRLATLANHFTDRVSLTHTPLLPRCPIDF